MRLIISGCPRRIVECEFNQPPDRRCGRNTCKIKRALGPAKVLVHAFERGEIESRLAAEIMIDHALVRARRAIISTRAPDSPLAANSICAAARIAFRVRSGSRRFPWRVDLAMLSS